MTWARSSPGKCRRSRPCRRVSSARPSIQAYLASGSRVQVRATANPWLTVDHRKCIIVDGRLAFVGGMNIGRGLPLRLA